MIHLKLVSTEDDALRVIQWIKSQKILGEYQRSWVWSKSYILDIDKINVYILYLSTQEVGFSYIMFKRFSRVEIGVTLFQNFRNLGLGTIVHQKLIDLVIGKYNYIEALIMEENLPEKKILEKLQFLPVDQFLINDFSIYKYRKFLEL